MYNAPDLAARLSAHLPDFKKVAFNCGYDLIEAIFADDGSSPPLVLKQCSVHQYALRIDENRGKGHAVRKAALAARGEWALMSDVDESAPLLEFARLAQSAGNAWMVCGSRWKRPGVPFFRRLLSTLFRLPVRFAGVRGIHDSQCGFKLFNMEKMRPIFEAQKINRFAFDVELLLAVQRAGGTIVEVPIEWHGRHRSSLNVMRDAPRMLWDVMKLRWKH